MKRLALSVFGGFVIPFAYSVIAFTLSRQVKSESLDLLAGVPVRWPLLFLSELGFHVEKNTATFLYLVASNVLLYTILTYCFLCAVLKRKTRESVPPPYPPSFVQH